MTLVLAIAAAVLLHNHVQMAQSSNAKVRAKPQSIATQGSVDAPAETPKIATAKITIAKKGQSPAVALTTAETPKITTAKEEQPPAVAVTSEEDMYAILGVPLIPHVNAASVDLTLSHAAGSSDTSCGLLPKLFASGQQNLTVTVCGASAPPSDSANMTTAATIVATFFKLKFDIGLVEDYADELSISSSTLQFRAGVDGVDACDAVVTASARRSKDDLKPHGRFSKEVSEERYSLCFAGCGVDAAHGQHHDTAAAVVRIDASTAVGVLHAWRTLLAMALTMSPAFKGRRDPTHPEGTSIAALRGCIHEDAPKVPWRGLHVDTARHFHPQTTMLELLRHMSRVKLNRFHWHLSDDQGWRLESKRYPGLHTVGGTRGPPLNGRKMRKYNGMAYPRAMYHTQAEAREVIAYAARRAIVVVPEVDLPAHAAAILAGLRGTDNTSAAASTHLTGQALADAFGTAVAANVGNDDCAAPGVEISGAPNCMGGTFGVMHPTEEAVAIAAGILREVCKVFHLSPHIHLGGDEAEFIRDGVWKNIPCNLKACKSAAANRQTLDYSAIQALLMDRLISVVEDQLACPVVSLPWAVKDARGMPSKPRSAVVWDETIVDLRKDGVPASSRTIGMLWRDDRIAIDDIAKHYESVGGPVALSHARLVLTPKTRLYFDYLQHSEVAKNRFWPLQRPAPWMKHKAVSLERGFMVHRLRTVEQWTNSLVYGVEGCLWSELIPNRTVLLYQLFPRLLGLADAAWSLRRHETLDKDLKRFQKKASEWESHYLSRPWRRAD